MKSCGRQKTLRRFLAVLCVTVIPGLLFTLGPGRLWQVRHPLDGLNSGVGRTDCSEIRIAVLDSGVDAAHPELAQAKLCPGRNFLDHSGGTPDTLGHGTAVIGVLAACDDRNGVCGLCPEASIYPLKILDDSGQGSVETVVEALHWCIEHEMDIVNLSFSTTLDLPELEAAVREVQAAGILIVAAVNNHGTEVPSYPSGYDGVFAVAAGQGKTLSEKDGVIYAPGTRLLCLDRDNGYRLRSGSSVAAPAVTALLARRIAAHPSEDPAQLRAALLQAAAD